MLSSEVIEQFLKDIHGEEGKDVLLIFADYLEENGVDWNLRRRRVKNVGINCGGYNYTNLVDYGNYGTGFGYGIGYEYGRGRDGGNGYSYGRSCGIGYGTGYGYGGDYGYGNSCGHGYARSCGHAYGYGNSWW